MGKRKRSERRAGTVTTTTTQFLPPFSTGPVITTGSSSGSSNIAWTPMSATAVADRLLHFGHILADPTVVAHCPFCGSGAIIAGGDGTITCDFCDRAFNVMEQPKYNAMPGDPNAVPPASGLPTAEDAAAVPGAVPAATGPAGEPPQHQPVNPQTDPASLAKAPPFKMGDGKPKDDKPKGDNPFAKKDAAVHTAMFRTAKGTVLDEDDFVAHLAFLHGREFMVGR